LSFHSSAEKQKSDIVVTEAKEQTIAPFAPDPKAEIITQDGTTDSSHNHQRNEQKMCRPSIDSGNKQYDFARERDTCAPLASLR
jgi:hypothetical protein